MRWLEAGGDVHVFIWVDIPKLFNKKKKILKNVYI